MRTELRKISDVRKGDCIEDWTLESGWGGYKCFTVGRIEEGVYSYLIVGLDEISRRYYKGWEVQVHETWSDCCES